MGLRTTQYLFGFTKEVRVTSAVPCVGSFKQVNLILVPDCGTVNNHQECRNFSVMNTKIQCLMCWDQTGRSVISYKILYALTCLWRFLWFKGLETKEQMYVSVAASNFKSNCNIWFSTGSLSQCGWREKHHNFTPHSAKRLF